MSLSERRCINRGRRFWPGKWNGWARVALVKELPTDAEVLMHLVATFFDVRFRSPSTFPEFIALIQLQRNGTADAITCSGPVCAVPGAGAKPAAPAGFGVPGAAPAFGAPKPFGAPAAAPFGAPAAPFGTPAAAAAPAGGAAPGGSTPSFDAKHVQFFSAEHFVPAPASAVAPEDKLRRQGAHVRTEMKQRPLVRERLDTYPQSVNTFPHLGDPHYLHYTVVLDRAKHAVLNSFGHNEGQRFLEVEPRPGPDNLFQMLAVFAIELKVRSI